MSAIVDIKASKIIQCISLIFLLYYVFFWDMKFVNSRYILIGLFVTAVLNIAIDRSVFFLTPLKGFLCVLLCNLLGIIGSGGSGGSYGVRLFNQMAICFIVFVCFAHCELSYKGILRVFIILCAIYTGGIFLQVINPGIVQTVNRAILDRAAFDSYHTLSKYKYYMGFSGFNCMSALFAGVLSGIYLSKVILFNNSFIKRLIYASIGFIGFIAMIVAQKRGIFVACAVSIIIMILISVANKKNIRKLYVAILLILLLFVGIYLYLQNSESGIEFIKRFTASDDISSGRFDIFSLLLTEAKNSFLLGKGTGASQNTLINSGAHNIYIQVYFDHGIIGILIYIIWFVSNFIFTIKLYRNASNTIIEKQILFVSMYVQILFLVYGLFGNPINDIYIFLLYVFFTALPCILKQRVIKKPLKKEETDEKA